MNLEQDKKSPDSGQIVFSVAVTVRREFYGEIQPVSCRFQVNEQVSPIDFRIRVFILSTLNVMMADNNRMLMSLIQPQASGIRTTIVCNWNDYLGDL